MNLFVPLFLIVVSIIDVKFKKIPIYIFTLFAGVAIISHPIDFYIWNFFPGLILLLFSYITRNNIGSGDSMVLLILGFYLECYEIFLLLIVALFMIAIPGIFVLIKYKKNHLSLPFIPFLFFSYLLFILF